MSAHTPLAWFYLVALRGHPLFPKLAESAHGDLGFAVALMALLTVGTTLFMPFALPLVIPGLQASPWSIARPLVVFILTPLAVGMLLQSQKPALSNAAQPIFAKLGNISVLVLLVLLVVRHFNDLLGVLGSGAIAASAVFFAGLYAAGYLLGGSGAVRRDCISMVHRRAARPSGRA